MPNALCHHIQRCRAYKISSGILAEGKSHDTLSDLRFDFDLIPLFKFSLAKRLDPKSNIEFHYHYSQVVMKHMFIQIFNKNERKQLKIYQFLPFFLTTDVNIDH